ncbi:SubName: Full=Uncharacterized protein {ECO:0000313/EMBL:CCA76013.1} [Serendipita indica DSM 11827]|uniref:Uncharacterized protein n=1 Tax=Serendipita indica (strain DSM 11827) TaxID=1109443 RepID=G4TXH0_SERID|nr:SubName: Full=Uncharacterized protein {ECO:0000313/EMBL:CCA76013.1} [Serendipita indica DSM 11827]CCA76013.1 hypothetical protein PIIN_10013 [Serendipita indica DSM 11827]
MRVGFFALLFAASTPLASAAPSPAPTYHTRGMGRLEQHVQYTQKALHHDTQEPKSYDKASTDPKSAEKHLNAAHYHSLIASSHRSTASRHLKEAMKHAGDNPHARWIEGPSRHRRSIDDLD